MNDSTFAKWPEVEPHLWTGGYTLGNVSETHFKENLLSYVERHDLTVVLSKWNTTEADAEALDERLQIARERGIDVWLGTYDLREHSDQELITDEAKLQHDVDRLARMVETYAEHYPDGKVFVWHEPPLTGKWTGETHTEKAKSMARYGPTIFAAQKNALDEQYPDVDLGLMVWRRNIAPPTHNNTPILEQLMGGLKDRGALPDFTYFDLYRGHYEWEGGYQAVNDYLEAIVENIREHTNDRPVYYLGEAHTINKQYTPSKQAILGDLQTLLDAGVDGYGWYVRTGYQETHPRNYNPFVPNPSADGWPEGSNSMIGSRDRFVWANEALMEATGRIDPSDRFDLWLYGHDFDFYEHRLSLRTADEEWEFIGDFSGYVDGDNPYAGGGRNRVVAFHALERERFLEDGELEVRIDSHDEGDGATLEGIYAVPYLDVAHYRTEPELTTLVEETASLDSYALGTRELDVDLVPGSCVEETLTSGDPSESLTSLVHPAQHEEFDFLRRLDTRSGKRADELFDLWVYGPDVGDVTTSIDGASIEGYADAAGNDTFAGPVQARVYRGLERSSFFDAHRAGPYLDLQLTTNRDATVSAVFAMPYHGSRNFHTDAEVAEIIQQDYDEGAGQLTTFSLGHQLWPNGIAIAADETLDTWVQLVPRRITEG